MNPESPKIWLVELRLPKPLENNSEELEINTRGIVIGLALWTITPNNLKIGIRIKWKKREF